MSIVRDGDHFIIGAERIPARTECAGRVLEWEADDGGMSRGVEYPQRIECAAFGYWACVYIVMPRWCVLTPRDECLDGAEPTVRDAQRRCLKVLSALLEPLGEE